MFRINGHAMSMDLTVLGYIRMGKPECVVCGQRDLTEITSEIKAKVADKLYGPEANGQVCECCGRPLAQVRLPLAI